MTKVVVRLPEPKKEYIARIIKDKLTERYLQL